MGGRSRVAAQMLAGKGFDQVYNLKGGINAWEGAKAWGPVDLNLDLVRGTETPAEMLAIGYAMEDGLLRFYHKALERTSEGDVKDLLQRLKGIEELHKERLLSAYQKIQPGQRPESALSVDRMEGGLEIESFIEGNSAFFEKAEDIMQLSMMLETQSLDLYLRFAEKCSQQDTKEVLYQTATEEKAHLSALGDMLEQVISP